jgi:hypothetical protein
MTPDEFFAGQEQSRQLFEAVHHMVEAIGAADLRVSKSQISFRRRKAFAWVWMPRTVLRGRGAPLVLTLSLGRRDPSPRWKEIVEPSPRRFTHHLELWTVEQIDGQVRDWLREAWLSAG